MNFLELIENDNYIPYVKYHIDLNKAILNKWNVSDYNIYNSLLAVLGKELSDNKKDSYNDTYVVSLKQIKELSSLKLANNKIWIDKALLSADKIMDIKLKWINGENSEGVMLSVFPSIKVNAKNETMTVILNPIFKYILEKLDKNYVFYDLEKITLGLNSKYSKALYPHLMQFKTIGSRRFSLERLKEIFGLTEKYSTKNINSKIIPILENELSTVFEDLLITGVRDSKKPGKPIVEYIFKFRPIKFDYDKYKTIETDKEIPIETNKNKVTIKEDVEFYTHRFIEEEKDIIYFEHLKPRKTKGGELHYYLDGEGILYTCFLDKDKKPIKMQVDGREYKLNSKMQEIYEDYKIENMTDDEVGELLGGCVSISYLRKKNVKETTINNIVNKIKFIQKALKENDENSEDYIYLAKPKMPIYRVEPKYWMDLNDWRSFQDWAFRNIAAENLSNKLVREFKEDYLIYNDLFKEFKNKYKIAKSEDKTVKLVEWNWQNDPDKTELYYIENQKKNEELNIEPTEQDIAEEIF